MAGAPPRNGRVLRLDLHVHTTASPDSTLTLERALLEARSRGLAGFALTDHNRVPGPEELERLRALGPGLLLVPGTEISTRQGHLLAFGLRRAIPRGLTYEESVARVRAEGGLPVAPHPFRWAHGCGLHGLGTPGLAGWEEVNGRTFRKANRRAAELPRSPGGSRTGGSDAHSPGELGRAFTEVEVESFDVDGVLRALSEGRCRGGGEGQSWGGRIRISLANAGKRLGRGLRPV